MLSYEHFGKAYANIVLQACKDIRAFFEKHPEVNEVWLFVFRDALVVPADNHMAFDDRHYLWRSTGPYTREDSQKTTGINQFLYIVHTTMKSAPLFLDPDDHSTPEA